MAAPEVQTGGFNECKTLIRLNSAPDDPSVKIMVSWEVLHPPFLSQSLQVSDICLKSHQRSYCCHMLPLNLTWKFFFLCWSGLCLSMSTWLLLRFSFSCSGSDPVNGQTSSCKRPLLTSDYVSYSYANSGAYPFNASLKVDFNSSLSLFVVFLFPLSPDSLELEAGPDLTAHIAAWNLAHFSGCPTAAAKWQRDSDTHLQLDPV